MSAARLLVALLGGVLLAFPVVYVARAAGVGGDGFSWLRVGLATSVILGANLIAWGIHNHGDGA